MIDEIIMFIEIISYIAVIFVVFMVVLGPVITFVLDLFIPYDDFPPDDDDDGYGF